jgi:AcrR family transcriptional regulator
MTKRMARRPIDRRVARTTKTLHHALISLILKKNYEAITIQEICDAANVGRSTFYAHYTSKDDLHQHGIESLRKVLTDRQSDAPIDEGDRGRSLSFSRTLFEHARDRKDLFRALAGSRGGAVALAASVFAALLPTWCATSLPRPPTRIPAKACRESLSFNLSLALAWRY